MGFLGSRNDSITMLLNDLGYQPLALVQTGLQAPVIYSYKDTKLDELGSLLDILAPGTPVPELTVREMPEVSRKESAAKSGSAVAGFMANALQIFGITSAPKLDAEAASQKDYTFSFGNVTSQGLSYLKTAQLIKKIDAAGLDNLDPILLRDGYIHIAYEFLFAGSVDMRDASGSAKAADAKALEIKKIIDVGAQVMVDKTSDDTWTFKPASGKPGAFACKIGRLEKLADGLKLHIHEDEGEGFLADEGGPRPYLLERGVVIRADGA